MLVYGALSSHRQTDPAKFTMPLFAPRLIYSTATVRGWWLPRWVPSQPLAEVRTATSDLLTMLSNGALTPPAIVRYSLKDNRAVVIHALGSSLQRGRQNCSEPRRLLPAGIPGSGLVVITTRRLFTINTRAPFDHVEVDLQNALFAEDEFGHRYQCGLCALAEDRAARSEE